MTLSDRFCVDRHRESFRDLVESHVDILFANEDEACALYEVSDLGEVFGHLRGKCELAVVTRSAKGSVVLVADDVIRVAAEPVDRVVDTTGAGDLFAAGFLYGLADRRDPEVCARLGSIAAAEIISHVGARPETPLADLAASKL